MTHPSTEHQCAATAHGSFGMGSCYLPIFFLCMQLVGDGHEERPKETPGYCRCCGRAALYHTSLSLLERSASREKRRAPCGRVIPVRPGGSGQGLSPRGVFHLFLCAAVGVSWQRRSCKQNFAVRPLCLPTYMCALTRPVCAVPGTAVLWTLPLGAVQTAQRRRQFLRK